MFAILGLLGLALAGTAFVGLMPSDTQDDGDEVNKDVIIEEPTEESTSQEPDAVAAPLADAVNEDYDALFGDDTDDTLDGQQGDDYLNGLDGDDTLLGGEGDDQLHGGRGDDATSGGDGDDLVYGYIGDDDLSGGAGDDTLHSGDGDDTLNGGYDDDELLGGAGDDTLFGGSGTDNLQGGEGDDVVDGTTGEEDAAEMDYLSGSTGEDTLIGNDGDVMSGGLDADQFIITDGVVSIMDFAEDDVLVLNYDGDAPDLTTERTEIGLTLLANGTPVASLYGLTSFDVANVQVVSS